MAYYRIGANIAAMLSYSTAKSSSKEPEKFGTGHEPGVIAAETANNSSIGGALIPLITMVFLVLLLMQYL